jgi:hypothetical protein
LGSQLDASEGFLYSTGVIPAHSWETRVNSCTKHCKQGRGDDVIIRFLWKGFSKEKKGHYNTKLIKMTLYNIIK